MTLSNIALIPFHKGKVRLYCVLCLGAQVENFCILVLKMIRYRRYNYDQDIIPSVIAGRQTATSNDRKFLRDHLHLRQLLPSQIKTFIII